MQKEEIKLQFKEYPSIQLSTRDKFVKMIKQQGYDNPNILWVASQKIHGSNFSIHYEGKQKIVKYGRRTDFLSQQIPIPCQNPGQLFNETFYDARQTVKKFHNNIQHIYQKIKSKYPSVIIIQIYGQYFGGSLPQNHPNYIKGPKAVQKGIHYTSNHQFMVFDIKVTTDNSVFWVDVLQIPQLLDGKIMYVPVYAKGTFEQIYSINTVFDSTIPQLLGLQKVQQNIIQGLVLRPNKNISCTKFGERIILKKKNQQFLQKASAPKVENKQKKQKPIDPQVVPFLDILTPYVNFNRVESVTSKFPDLKDRNKLKQQIVKDLLIDAQKDQYKSPQNQQIAKKVKTQLQKIVIKEINSYFIKH